MVDADNNLWLFESRLSDYAGRGLQPNVATVPCQEPIRSSHSLPLSKHCTQKTHTHPFNGLLSATTRASRYQQGKTNLDFTEARDSEWHWHQLGHMQVCTSLQTDNHASTPTTQFFTGRMPFLPPNQQCQSTEGTTLHSRLQYNTHFAINLFMFYIRSAPVKLRPFCAIKNLFIIIIILKFYIWPCLP